MTKPTMMKMTAAELANELGLKIRPYRTNGQEDPTKVTIRTDGNTPEARATLAEFINRVVNLQVYRRKDKRVTEGNNNFFAFFHKEAFDKVSKVRLPVEPKQPKAKKDTAIGLLKEMVATLDPMDEYDEDYVLFKRVQNFLDKQ